MRSRYENLREIAVWLVLLLVFVNTGQSILQKFTYEWAVSNFATAMGEVENSHNAIRAANSLTAFATKQFEDERDNGRSLQRQYNGLQDEHGFIMTYLAREHPKIHEEVVTHFRAQKSPSIADPFLEIFIPNLIFGEEKK